MDKSHRPANYAHAREPHGPAARRRLGGSKKLLWVMLVGWLLLAGVLAWAVRS